MSLFERAYLRVYDEKMDRQAQRLRQSWEDYMREWVQRSDFRAAGPQLLEGEDPAFTHAIQAMVEEDLQRERGNPVQPAGERRIMFPHMRAAWAGEAPLASVVQPGRH